MFLLLKLAENAWAAFRQLMDLVKDFAVFLMAIT